MGRSLAFLLPPMLLAATVEGLLTVRPDCQESCGGVDIPYPFGIGAGCFLRGFEITCLNNNTMPVLPASTGVVRVLSLLVMPRPEARVMLPVSWMCYNSAGNGTATGSLDGGVNFNKDNVYRISNTHNELFVLGCNTFAYTMSWCTAYCNDPLSAMYTFYSGCTTYCNDSRSAQDGACAGVGCCHIDIPPGIGDNLMKFDRMVARRQGVQPLRLRLRRGEGQLHLPGCRPSHGEEDQHAAAARLGRPGQQRQLHGLPVLRPADPARERRLRQRPQRVRRLHQWPRIRLQLHQGLRGKPIPSPRGWMHK